MEVQAGEEDVKRKTQSATVKHQRGYYSKNSKPLCCRRYSVSRPWFHCLRCDRDYGWCYSGCDELGDICDDCFYQISKMPKRQRYAELRKWRAEMEAYVSWNAGVCGVVDRLTGDIVAKSPQFTRATNAARRLGFSVRVYCKATVCADHLPKDATNVTDSSYILPAFPA